MAHGATNTQPNLYINWECTALKNIIGDRFGLLTVISYSGVYTAPCGQTDPIFLCKCDCGVEKDIRQSALLCKSRPTKACGCLRTLRLKENPPRLRHGETNTLLHFVWSGMRDRCKNSYNGKHHRYVDRGISICDEWDRSYEAFRDWALSNGYKKGLSIDRIDNDGNYEPQNCRFVDSESQNNNRSTNVNICIFGETKTLTRWSKDERCKTTYSSFVQRIDGGWDAEKALTTPLINGAAMSTFFTVWGESKTLGAWSRDERCKVSHEALKERLKKGWDLERSLCTPSRNRHQYNARSPR